MNRAPAIDDLVAQSLDSIQTASGHLQSAIAAVDEAKLKFPQFQVRRYSDLSGEIKDLAKKVRDFNAQLNNILFEHTLV